MAANPGFDGEAMYVNQAYKPNTPGDSSKPPPYPPHSSPPPGTVAYYPQQYPQGQPQMMYPPPQSLPPGNYPPQYPQQVQMMYAPQGGQQSTTVVLAASSPPVVVQQVPYVSYCGMIVFACLVFWFCNALFGLIAFILAVVAENTKTTDAKGAQRLGKASMWLSIVGIIATCVIVAIAVGVSVGTTTKRSRQVVRNYISPSTCCLNNGYVYPGSGSYCYGTRSYGSYSCYYSYLGDCYSYSYSLSSTCCDYSNDYYYQSSSTYGYCYYYSY